MKKLHLNFDKSWLVYAGIGLLSILVLSHVYAGYWTGDFFDHAAVLGELIRNPFSPKHPVIGENIPHAFFSPYLVGLGIIGHNLNGDPFEVLKWGAIINFPGLLWAFWLLIKHWYPTNPLDAYWKFLLLHLFAWGPMAWFWSSFFHLKVLPFVLPYPSTFALILSVFTWALYLDRQKEKDLPTSILKTALLSFMATIILLVHPTTFLFLAGLILGHGSEKWKDIRTWLEITIILGFPFFLVLAWPYFPFWDLLLGEGIDSRFHLDSVDLYENLWWRLFPFFVFPFLFRTYPPSSKWILTVAFWGVIYLYGLLSNSFGYGRVISFIVMWGHLYLVGLLRMNTPAFSWKEIRIYALGLVFLCSSYQMFSGGGLFAMTKKVLPPKEEPFYVHWKHLAAHKGKMVMVPPEILPFAPAFGVYTPATTQPPYWIEDAEDRLIDVDVFYSDTTSDATRKFIRQKYSVDVVLKESELPQQ